MWLHASQRNKQHIHTHLHIYIHACNTQTLQMSAYKNTFVYIEQSQMFSVFLPTTFSLSTHTHKLRASRTMLFSLAPCVFYCPNRSAMVRNLIQAPNRNHGNPFLWEFFCMPPAHTYTHTETYSHSMEWLCIFSLTLKNKNVLPGQTANL